MEQTDNDKEIDFEIGIAMRMDALVARKRAENELVIARIATLDTAWTDVNRDIDKDLKTGLDTARVETQAVRDAKERLTRNVCEGVDKKAFGLAGKVVDVKSKIGLPGLTVRLALAETAEQKSEAETDNYGDFFFTFALDTVGKLKQVNAMIVVLFDSDTVVYREERSIEPKAGAIEHVILAVDCSGKLEDVLEHGRQVAASVEGDAKLVEARAANFENAYAVFEGLSETTLSQLRSLKQELSVSQPTEDLPEEPDAGKTTDLTVGEEAKKNALEEERKKLDEEQKKLEEERKKAQEEAKVKAREEEKRKLADERKKLEEEAKKEERKKQKEEGSKPDTGRVPKKPVPK